MNFANVTITEQVSPDGFYNNKQVTTFFLFTSDIVIAFVLLVFILYGLNQLICALFRDKRDEWRKKVQPTKLSAYLKYNGFYRIANLIYLWMAIYAML